MSKAYKIVRGTTQKLINLRNIAKVKLDNKEITFYYLSNGGIKGINVAGSGFLNSDNMIKDCINFDTEKQAQEEFDKIAELL